MSTTLPSSMTLSPLTTSSAVVFASKFAFAMFMDNEYVICGESDVIDQCNMIFALLTFIASLSFSRSFCTIYPP